MSQIFGILMAAGGFALAYVQRTELSKSIPLDAFCGGMILIGAFLLTPEKMKAALDEVKGALPWNKGS